MITPNITSNLYGDLKENLKKTIIDNQREIDTLSNNNIDEIVNNITKKLENVLIEKRAIVKKGNSYEVPLQRTSGINYFSKILNLIEVNKLFELTGYEIYDKYIFAPNKQNTSLYYELKKDNKINIENSIEDRIKDEYFKEVGKDPYERHNINEISTFISRLYEYLNIN